LPSIGFSILVALALRRINVGRAKLFGQPALQIAPVLLLAGLLGFATSYQHIYWSNDLLLYQRGLFVAPNSSVARNNLGDLLSKKGFYEEAIALFQQVVSKDPNFWESVYNLGYNYYKLGKYQEAEPWLRQGIQMNNTNANQYLTLGVVLFETNRFDEAEAALRYGIGLKRDGYGLHYALGAVLKTKGDLPGALDEFKLESAYNPRHPDTTEQVAQIEQQLGGGTGNRPR
ncbi:MAG TPA: tetratricopeptide repeat protein, partial [Blastocatellia bacterium]